MQCKQCETELTGRQRDFGSDKCRKQTSRTKPEPEDAPQSPNADETAVERGHNERGQRTRTVPGDAGYEGCCKLVDGEWQVDNTKPPIKGMSTDELVRRLHFIEDWQRSPEHREVLSRRVGSCL